MVGQIPPGRVATYGQIAIYVHGCGARQVGYALSALPRGSTVPWHRVINRDGEISERSMGGGAARQRLALEAEGVLLDHRGRIDFDRYGWARPECDAPDRAAPPAARRQARVRRVED